MTRDEVLRRLVDLAPHDAGCELEEAREARAAYDHGTWITARHRELLRRQAACTCWKRDALAFLAGGGS